MVPLPGACQGMGSLLPLGGFSLHNAAKIDQLGFLLSQEGLSLLFLLIIPQGPGPLKQEREGDQRMPSGMAEWVATVLRVDLVTLTSAGVKAFLD